MGELNAVPMRINNVEGAAGQVKLSGGPGVLETWGSPADVALNNAPGTNDTGSGLITIDTVGEIVTAGQALYLKADGKYWKALATGIATMPGKVLAMAGIAADAAGNLLHLGYFRHDAWDFTVGNGTANLLYVDRATGGLVTQTPPATAGDQVQVIGYCVTADIIFFTPCLELVEIA